MDFQSIMVLALVVLGLIWLADVVLMAPRRRAALANATDEAEKEAIMKLPVLVDYARSFFPIILVVLVLRSFLVEPFRIPSGSMMPTLVAGDFILVNKYTYGIRLPVVYKKIIDINIPAHGDVVVFRYPKDPSVDYIKRVVGLPGDRIGYFNRVVYVNGVEAEQVSLGQYNDTGAGIMMNGADMIKESLDGVDHRILINPYKQSGEGEFVVPEGRYFVMGDNRDNSNDSRFWGTVPEENLVGKAILIWMSWDADKGGVQWNRIGTSID